MKEKETGWKPLPTSLKVVFVLLCLGLISSLFSLISISELGVEALGLTLTGGLALLYILLVFIIAVIILLVAIWNRYTWTWKYAIVYLAFLILDNFISLINLPSKVIEVSSKIQIDPQVIFMSVLVGLLFGVIINIIFLAVMYKKRKYFG